MLKNFFNNLSSLLFPPNCLVCQRGLIHELPERTLCSSCRQRIVSNIPPFCVKCSRPLSRLTDTKLCSVCSKTPVYFDQAWGATLYTEAMKRLLHFFKYGQKISLRTTLAECIFSFIERHQLNLGGFDVTVSIPLHPTRQRERGYNQSQLLAEQICKRYRLPLCSGNLKRIRHTPHQALLNQKERWTNIQGAFKIDNPLEFSKRSVLIVDDLLTTGATVSEAARLLKESEARHIGVLTLAIAS